MRPSNNPKLFDTAVFGGTNWNLQWNLGGSAVVRVQVPVFRPGKRVAARPVTQAASSGEPTDGQTAGAFSGGGRRPQPAPAGSVAGRAAQRDQRAFSPQRTAPGGERLRPVQGRWSVQRNKAGRMAPAILRGAGKTVL